MGAGLPQLPGLAGDAKSYAERLFDFPEIDSLGPDEVADAVAIPAAEWSVDYSPEALQLIVAESHGYPYFLQEWGYHVWNHAPESPITGDDVRSLRPVVIDQLDRNFFLVRFDRLTPKEKEIPSSDGHARAWSSSLGRHCRLSRRPSGIRCPTAVRADRQGHDLQPGPR